MKVTSTNWARRRWSDSGFTLVEIMVVVVIIGLLAALAIPAFQKNRRAVQARTFINELRLIRHASEEYVTEHADWPPDGSEKICPELMEYLHDDLNKKVAAVGGKWDWDKMQFGCTAGISVYQPTADAVQMQEIDAAIDDGNLSTGKFHARTDGYIYVIAP